MLREESSSSQSVKSGRSQLVDLMVEDNEAEATERVRARKEGRLFIRTLVESPSADGMYRREPLE